MELKGTGSADSHVIRYRADIDGLRAVAVLSVVAFHLWRTASPGGYLGVDIFFVLSGYLITSILWREVQEGSFSIVRFYDRRVRRIMPALLLLLIVCTPLASWMLLPSDLLGYGRSLLATLGFVANIYFWRDTNYFARAAQEKPLLHLWSLGVEEQFYILFPLILALLWRWWPRRAPAVIGALTLGSLAANAVALWVGADSTAFFLLPTRAWELGIGAMIAVLPANAAPRPAQADWMAGIGALLVVASLMFVPQTSRIIPVALPAAIGIALLILAGRQELSRVNRALQVRPLRFIGLVSYSLYLWHWPVIVFAQYYLVRDLNGVEIAAAVALMMACAVGSWHFVERPFRRAAMPIRNVRYIAGLAVAALAASAAGLLWFSGLPGRLGVEAAMIDRAVGTNYRCPVSQFIILGKSRACLMNLPSRNAADADVILLGNSHAQMYAPIWTSLLIERGQTGLLVPANGCLPMVLANISRECIDTARQNLAEVKQLPRARTVILGLDWAHGPQGLVDAQGRTVDNAEDAALIAALDDLIVDLEHAGKQVVLIGPIAEPGWDVASTMSRALAFGRPIDRPTFLPKAQFDQRYGAAIGHFEARHDMRFARPDRVQCIGERCAYLLDGRPLFADNGHIAAAELDRFRGVFEAAIAPAPGPTPAR
jgi:peptidoglycan/LPS O-acetylase OafA/YrhL